jgi:hypothetical protein
MAITNLNEEAVYQPPFCKKMGGNFYSSDLNILFPFLFPSPLHFQTLHFHPPLLASDITASQHKMVSGLWIWQHCVIWRLHMWFHVYVLYFVCLVDTENGERGEERESEINHQNRTSSPK